MTETSGLKASFSEETKQIHPRIRADNKAWLDEEVRTRGVAVGEILDRAIEQYRSPENVSTHQTQWVMEVLKCQEQILQNQYQLTGNIAIALEAISMFARVYFSVTPEPKEEDKEYAERRGSRRYKSFVTAIANRLQSKQNLLTDLPEYVWKALEQDHA